jgi:hypothetical protein
MARDVNGVSYVSYVSYDEALRWANRQELIEILEARGWQVVPISVGSVGVQHPDRPGEGPERPGGGRG